MLMSLYNGVRFIHPTSRVVFSTPIPHVINETDFENLGFGEVFSDHMFSMEYKNGEWTSPQIVPFGKIEIFPSLCSLHYGQVVFEGLKAFHTKNGINIFRPEKYHDRMNKSSQRLCIPEIDYSVGVKG